MRNLLLPRLAALSVMAAVAVALSLAGPLPAAQAKAADECGTTTCVTGKGGSFVGVGVKGGGGASGTPGGRGSRGTGGPTSTVVVERSIAPACSGNSATDDQLLCTGAVSICPTPGEVAFWVWTRTVDRARPGSASSWQRIEVPPYECYGPGTAAIPPEAAIAGLVERDFGQYPLPRAVVRTEPAGQTLVNLANNVFTDTPLDKTFVVLLVGRQVTITGHAESWTWHFGDGAATTTDTPGRAGTLDISHTYLHTGLVNLTVTVVWSGTYQIAGSSAVLPVRGTATTTGPPTPLDVRAARSQYQAR